MRLKCFHSNVLKAIIVLGLSAVLSSSIQSPVLSSDRSIFGESPSDVEEYFGPYWTRLTLGDEGGDRTVTYTYNPGSIRSFFDNSEDLRLSIRFTNDQADSIRIHQDGAGFNIPPHRFESSNDPMAIFDDVFASVFGYRPSAASPIYRRILEPGSLQGTLHTVIFCISEEIAVSYEWISNEDFIWFIKLFQEPACI